MPFRQMDPWLFVLMFNVDILCAFAFTRRSTITVLPQIVNTSHFCLWPLLSYSGNRWFSLFLLTGLSVHQWKCWTEGTRKWKPWTQAQGGRLSNTLHDRFRQHFPDLWTKAVLFLFMPLENPPKWATSWGKPLWSHRTSTNKGNSFQPRGKENVYSYKTCVLIAYILLSQISGKLEYFSFSAPIYLHYPPRLEFLRPVRGK